MYDLQKSVSFYIVLTVPNINSQGKWPAVETYLKEKNSIYKLEGKEKSKQNTHTTLKNLQMLFAVV